MADFNIKTQTQKKIISKSIGQLKSIVGQVQSLSIQFNVNEGQ